MSVPTRKIELRIEVPGDLWQDNAAWDEAMFQGFVSVWAFVTRERGYAFCDQKGQGAGTLLEWSQTWLTELKRFYQNRPSGSEK